MSVLHVAALAVEAGLAAYGGTSILLRGVARACRRKAPINLINGIILPHPGDDRWSRGQSEFCPTIRHPNHHPEYRLGAVVVRDGHGITIAGEPLRETGAEYQAYRKAVERELLERKALESL